MIEDTLKKINYVSKFKNSIVVATKHETVFIDLNSINFEYKIIEILPSGKLKVRRRVNGRTRSKSIKGKPKCDQFGNHLCDPFKSYADARAHAINFADNHLKLTLDYGSKS